MAFFKWINWIELNWISFRLTLPMGSTMFCRVNCFISRRVGSAGIRQQTPVIYKVSLFAITSNCIYVWSMNHYHVVQLGSVGLYFDFYCCECKLFEHARLHRPPISLVPRIWSRTKNWNWTTASNILSWWIWFRYRIAWLQMDIIPA